MTTIAWDGKTLAADKRASYGTMVRTTTKIRRIRGALVAAAGVSASCNALIDWYANGAVIGQFPPCQDSDDRMGRLVVVTKDGVFLYEGTPFPTRIEDKHFATGSGCEYALTAMYLGKSAAEAVEIASVFDPGTGGGVDTLTLRKR